MPDLLVDIDMPPEAFAEEAKEALRVRLCLLQDQGAALVDVFEQVDAIGKVSPSWFRLDLDWNNMLLNAGNAAPVLTELDKQERVAIYELPIMQRDVEGHRQLRQKTTRRSRSTSAIRPSQRPCGTKCATGSSSAAGWLPSCARAPSPLPSRSLSGCRWSAPA